MSKTSPANERYDEEELRSEAFHPRRTAIGMGDSHMIRKEKENQLILNTPASWWGAMRREALPSGNGNIGATVYGAVNLRSITTGGKWASA